MLQGTFPEAVLTAGATNPGLIHDMHHIEITDEAKQQCRKHAYSQVLLAMSIMLQLSFCASWTML